MLNTKKDLEQSRACRSPCKSHTVEDKRLKKVSKNKMFHEVNIICTQKLFGASHNATLLGGSYEFFCQKTWGRGGYKMSLKSITSVVLTKADWAKKCVTFYSMELQKAELKRVLKVVQIYPRHTRKITSHFRHRFDEGFQGM